MAAKKHADFEEFLQQEGLDGSYNTEIAARLSKVASEIVSRETGEKRTVKIGRITIQRIRDGQNVNPRTSWEVWLGTKRSVKSLRPKSLNLFKEWMFQRDLTEDEVAKQVGINPSTLRVIMLKAGKGITTSTENKEKLYRLTGLRMFTSGAATKSSVSRVKTGPVEEKPFEQDESVDYDQRLIRLEQQVTQIAGVRIPTGRELLGEILQSLGQMLLEKAPEGQDLHTESVESIMEIPQHSERVQSLVEALEKEVAYYSTSSEEERRQLRVDTDALLFMKVGTAIMAIIKEKDWQGWLATRQGI